MMLPIVEAEMAVGARESMMPDKCSYPLFNVSWRVWRGDLIEPRA